MRYGAVVGVTAHCPHCGEPVTLVYISRLVAVAETDCTCDVEPEHIGPEYAGFEAVRLDL